MSIFDQLAAGVVTSSADEMRSWGERVATVLPPNSTVALHGNLGVGKTTWVQGLALGLGVQERATSPTFNIFTLHRGSRGNLIHLDAYRLNAARQLEALMLDDFLVPPYWLAIEWPEKIETWLPLATRHFRFSIVEPGKHRVEYQA